MTNEKKANEIARDMLPYNNAEYHACYNSAMKAMQWKDEQREREKQQWIKEACERLEDYFAPDGSMVPENIRLWRDLQRVIQGE